MRRGGDGLGGAVLEVADLLFEGVGAGSLEKGEVVGGACGGGEGEVADAEESAEAGFVDIDGADVGDADFLGALGEEAALDFDAAGGDAVLDGGAAQEGEGQAGAAGEVAGDEPRAEVGPWAEVPGGGEEGGGEEEAAPVEPEAGVGGG